LSLDGVEWVHEGLTAATPGKGVEFELKFTERLALQVCSHTLQEMIVPNSATVSTRRFSRRKDNRH
jgi:hypothetical protein